MIIIIFSYHNMYGYMSLKERYDCYSSARVCVCGYRTQNVSASLSERVISKERKYLTISHWLHSTVQIIIIQKWLKVHAQKLIDEIFIIITIIANNCGGSNIIAWWKKFHSITIGTEAMIILTVYIFSFVLRLIFPIRLGEGGRGGERKKKQQIKL